MNNIERDNKDINIFMGWYIEVETSDDYPNQEWHTTKNRHHENMWDSGKCVRLDEPNVEENRISTDNDLWKTLCREGSPRGGNYSTSWDSLMPVIRTIKDKCSTYIDLPLHTDIEIVFDEVVKFTKKYNTHDKGI